MRKNVQVRCLLWLSFFASTAITWKKKHIPTNFLESYNFSKAMFWDSSLYLPKEKLFNFAEFYFAFKLQMIDKKERKKKQDKTNDEKQTKILIFFHYIHESHVIICNNLFSYFLSFVKRTKGLFTYTNITGFIKP